MRPRHSRYDLAIGRMYELQSAFFFLVLDRHDGQITRLIFTDGVVKVTHVSIEQLVDGVEYEECF